MGDQTCCGMLQLGLKKAMPYLLMVGLQCGSAGMYIISDATLKQGMSRYVLIVYRNAIAAISLAPFAFFFERQIRPKMTVSIFLKIMVLAILKPILDQNLSYLGMNLTSASFASAIMNAVPAVTFVLALILRLEQLKIKEERSQATVLGTLLTFAGALIMTIYKGPIINFIWSQKASHLVQSNDRSDKHWLTGTLCILVGCFCMGLFLHFAIDNGEEVPSRAVFGFLDMLDGHSAERSANPGGQASSWHLGDRLEL
ncbi:hypothetical protein RHGRI_031649 [Rhododendron griersonianum]|uniref:WAT1-related protein n=1 Tax=Rhododendron griersonianum TaxID=479676 RepID=A0AAV6IEF4_9ERIC|nr:hypothetical protein RHGRI_031649 [Rhododendron griersonianum]